MCGRQFWDNNNGAKSMCLDMGYLDWSKASTGGSYSRSSLWAGTCKANEGPLFCTATVDSPGGCALNEVCARKLRRERAKGTERRAAHNGAGKSRNFAKVVTGHGKTRHKERLDGY